MLKEIFTTIGAVVSIVTVIAWFIGSIVGLLCYFGIG